MKPVLGIDIGGTKLAFAARRPDGRVLARAKAPVRKETAQQAGSMAAAVLAEAGLGWPDVGAAGACVPGIYYAATGAAWAPNRWGWNAVPLRDELAANLPVPVAIDSDRSAYVLGEQWLGAAQGLTDVVFLAVGTGIGAGILAGLMQAGDLLIAAIRRAVLDWAQPVAARDTRIELSRLGQDAGMLGAARLALGGF